MKIKDNNQQLDICNESIPKYVRYKIANELNYQDLMSLCNVNKTCSEMCNDDRYWMNRIYDKIGVIPKNVKNGEYRDWYIKNVNNLYYIDDKMNTDSQAVKLLANVSNVAPYNNFSDSEQFVVYFVDALHNLKYINGTKDNFKENFLFGGVKKIVWEHKESFDHGPYIIYLDDSDTLIVHDLEIDLKLEISKNVKMVKCYEITTSNSIVIRLYYTKNDKLYIVGNVTGFLHGGETPYETDLYVSDVAYIGDAQNEDVEEEELLEFLVYVDLKGNVIYKDKILAKNSKKIFEYMFRRNLNIYSIDKYDILFILSQTDDNVKRPRFIDYDVKCNIWQFYNGNEYRLYKNGNLYLKNLTFHKDFKLIMTNVIDIYVGINGVIISKTI